MLNTPYAQTPINRGAEVFGADGEKVGSIAGVYPGYIMVEKGFFFPTDYYIPRSAIASADAERIYLAITKDAALGRGWDVRPVDLESATASTIEDRITDIDRLAASRVATDTGEEIRIPVMEEELTATMRPQAAGAVRIAKNVVAEDRVLDVPVTEERVRVERRAVDRAATAADLDAFEDQVIEVPLRTEAVDIQKQARVKEEVIVSKDAVQRTERVTDTVRREEVTVDDAGTGASTRTAGYATRVPANAVRGDGATACPPDYPVKGNADSGLFHEPASSAYAQTIPEICFASAEAAEAAGFSAAGSW
jgi:uncharacterized protein (TIGR02271 family)